MRDCYSLFRSWRCVKEDYLHHFSLPRLDLLAWVLITKLAPTYYRKLEVMLNEIGRFCELPKWRKDFKVEWKKAMRTPITMPLNERYRPDVKWFVCTCPQFVVSRFLVCKHLVQRFHPVNPRFFLEVTRNRSLPFWSHPSLKPLSIATEGVNSEVEVDPPTATDGDGDDTAHVEVYHRLNTAGNEFDDINLESDDDDALIDTWCHDPDASGHGTCTTTVCYHIVLLSTVPLVPPWALLSHSVLSMITHRLTCFNCVWLCPALW